MKIDEVTSSSGVDMAAAKTTSAARISAHSHVKGLGLDAATGQARPSAAGFIGQTAAREAAGIIVDMVRARKMAGRAVLFAGPPGTGKVCCVRASHTRAQTAISLAMAHELGDAVPFVSLVASQVYSAEVKKTEVLMSHFRRAIALRVKETKEVYEGECTEVTPVETAENPTGGYGKTVSHVLLGLKTAKGGKQLRLDPTIYESLVKQRVEVGDVIYIEANSGAVKRMGRCDAYAAEHDLEADTWVPLPKGDVHKRRECVQYVSLHDLDSANARPHNDQSDMQAMLTQLQKPRATEITDRLRAEINKVVDGYIDEGVGELHPGVLFIDEVHMLDMDCFTFLARALESRVAPVVVLATNRGVCTVNGSQGLQSAHGVPPDLLDRLLIIPTKMYAPDEVRQIVAMRAQAERVSIDDRALDRLADIGADCSLRYAVQLLSPARLLAQVDGRDTVAVQDIDECRTMFMDAKMSARVCLQQEKPDEKMEVNTSA